MVAGCDAPTHGEGKNSWLTGTAAWTFTCISQYILGIQPTFDGLKIDPCIPDSMKHFTCERTFRNANYHITVDNSAGVEKGVAKIIVDGTPIDTQVIPIQEGKTDYQIEVIMGV